MGMLHTLLVIEDDKTFRGILRSQLENQFLVLEAANAMRTMSILEQYTTDVILMDLYLEDGYGISLIEKIRNISKAPLIVLSGENDDKIKLQTFEMGADDFVSKPCNVDILVAKINAYIRRIEDPEAPLLLESEQKNEHIHFANWTLDLLKFQLFNNDNNSAELTVREFTLLHYLIKNSGRAITREELCEATKEDNYIPTPRALDVKITRLRKKIEEKPDDPHIIQTIRGVGYMFDSDKIKTD